eukprot:scaffold20842_cov34-Isochrysis_galbana.AAC.1
MYPCRDPLPPPRQSVDSFRPDGVLLGVDSIYNYWKPTWASNRPPHFVKELFLTEGDSSMLMVRKGGYRGGDPGSSG